ncbi:hypothetical protein [Leptolyngbya sp. FACHB-261]|uniref:hypothetical protein n=1 Tax=Leptolyngbya sp. FACHB-261 TaxID=2692806 RepID=UPI001686493A|nr:hypothetical protein [Leptolyngbya sp. FACHB-261]MBD2101182.1 hypothetical protein [Leptolyngbya sp. FACHB-261]
MNVTMVQLNRGKLNQDQLDKGKSKSSPKFQEQAVISGWKKCARGLAMLAVLGSMCSSQSAIASMADAAQWRLTANPAARQLAQATPRPSPTSSPAASPPAVSVVYAPFTLSNGFSTAQLSASTSNIITPAGSGSSLRRYEDHAARMVAVTQFLCTGGGLTAGGAAPLPQGRGVDWLYQSTNGANLGRLRLSCDEAKQLFTTYGERPAQSVTLNTGSVGPRPYNVPMLNLSTATKANQFIEWARVHLRWS